MKELFFLHIQCDYDVVKKSKFDFLMYHGMILNDIQQNVSI